jgi:hypothetical protein
MCKSEFAQQKNHILMPKNNFIKNSCYFNLIARTKIIYLKIYDHTLARSKNFLLLLKKHN